jgi:hypothetical protein
VIEGLRAVGAIYLLARKPLLLDPLGRTKLIEMTADGKRSEVTGGEFRLTKRCQMCRF